MGNIHRVGNDEYFWLEGGEDQKGPAKEEEQVPRARGPQGTGPEGHDEAAED